MAFSKLPIEILIEIFSYLDYCTIHGSIKRVCRTFKYAASACTVKLPGRLEPKLWAAIFSYLNYFDLTRRLTPICKQFAHIIKHFDNPSFAGTLFREKLTANSSPITANTKVEYHPVFIYLAGYFRNNIDELYINYYRGGSGKFRTLWLASENATFPPSDKIILRGLVLCRISKPFLLEMKQRPELLPCWRWYKLLLTLW